MNLEELFRKIEETGSWYGLTIQSLEDMNCIGDTPLHTVCSWGDLDAVKLLIDAGADVNALGDQDGTPLFNAIIGKKPEVVKLLLDKGAEKDRPNAFNRTPSQYVRSISSDPAMLKLFK